MKALILSQMQEQMDAAVECIHGERFVEAIAAFNECAHLTNMLKMEKDIPTPAKAKKDKQLTIELPHE